MSKPTAQLILGCIMLAIFCWMLCGCAMFQKKGVIKSGGATVAAVADAGKPATLATSDGKESLAIPKDTTVTITEHEATPTAPAFKVTELHFNTPTEWQKFTATVAANTGTMDTSVALKKIDVDSRKPLLYMMIAAILAAAFSMYTEHPNAAMWCAGGAAVFFAAWRISAIPEWVICIGVLACGGAIGMHLGFFKGAKAVTQPTVT